PAGRGRRRDIVAAGAPARRPGPRARRRGQPGPAAPARDDPRPVAGLSADGRLDVADRADDLLRLPRRHGVVPIGRHPRPPAAVPDGVVERDRGARRCLLRAQARLLRRRRRRDHHRDRRRHRLPPPRPAEGPSVITLTGVAKHYSSEVAIGPVDLTIPAGGVIALVGPNGAGKSTVLTMIGRLLAPDSGTVEVGGLDVHRTPSKQIAKKVSILRQENHFVTRLTVRQLVGFGRYPYSGGRLTQLDEDKISEAIDFLNLTELEQRFLDQLSGGQRQRA